MTVRIVWDPPKQRLNLQSHGLDFGTVTRDVLADAIIRPAKKGRLQAIVTIDDRAVSLIFSPLGSEAVSPLSLRDASDKERALP